MSTGLPSGQHEGMATNGVAMPEWLARRDIDNGPWTVTAAPPLRGAPCTNIGERTMKVPFGSSDAARVIRAHEMMHAKVSPVVLDASTINPRHSGLDVQPSMDALIVAEEMRVNYLIGTAGFNLDHLTDGSEKHLGKTLAQDGTAAWNSIVMTLASMFGSKTTTAFLSGIRSVDPILADLAKIALGTIRKEHRRTVKTFGTEWIASTEHKSASGDPGYPIGFLTYTVRMAALIDSLLDQKSSTIDTDGFIERSDEEKREDLERRVKGKGTWATPILDTSVVLSHHVDGRIGRKRIASATGRTPRHLDRLLTDPERRVFDRRSRGKGGVVLIDQSGSMHLDGEDIQKMIAAAPGCVIIGYSHASSDTSGIPNIWVLANRGKVAEELRYGNGGNGVDGPALRFALSHRRGTEPVIWVCDGVVTDSTDMPHNHLNEECASLVVQHRVHMVHDPVSAIEALRIAATGHLSTRLTGPLRDTAAARRARLDGIA